MTIEAVIDAGTFTWFQSFHALSAKDIVGNILICIVCAFIFGAIMGAAIEEDDEPMNRLAIIVFLIFFLFFFSLFFYIGVRNTGEGKLLDQWEETVAQPYYDQLPYKTKQIDILSVTGTEHPQYFHITYTEKLRDGSLMNESITAKIIKETGRKDISYAYKELSEDIPHFRKKGRYEHIVRVPSDYEFEAK